MKYFRRINTSVICYYTSINDSVIACGVNFISNCLTSGRWFRPNYGSTITVTFEGTLNLCFWWHLKTVSKSMEATLIDVFEMGCI